MSEQSRQASPSRSIDELERLVLHFVAAKRSLSSTPLVSRAHDVVTTARGLVEETAVLTAKNAFVRQGVLEEATVLVAVRDALDSIGRETDVDFKVRPIPLSERLQLTASGSDTSARSRRQPPAGHFGTIDQHPSRHFRAALPRCHARS